MDHGLEEQPDVEQLVLQAQHGCSVSYGELVRRFQNPLLHFLRQLTDRDCEDLVQETFIRAYRHLHQYRRKWRFSTWLFTIARRLSINAQRSNRPAADSHSLETLEAGGPSPADAVASEESRARLWDLAASALNRDQYTAIYLYYVDDMSVEEVAQVLERSRGAVKKMLYSARKRLQPLLRRLDADDPLPTAEPPTDKFPTHRMGEADNG